jgi:GNAT superfamily N-acetyltransferase
VPDLRCLCGDVLPGADEAALLAALRAHARARHADFPLTDARAREIVRAQLRATPWDGRRRALPGALEVRALEPDRTDDFLGFFDRDAFPDNPMWAGCYCLFHQFRGELAEWGKRGEAENRAEKAELVRTGRSHGWLAYAGGRVVGWCHAAPRAELPGLAREPAVDATPVGSIACFVVAPPYRRSGVARQLLDAACDGFRRAGLAFAEGYPRRGTGSDAHAFHGPLDLYLSAGFAIALENDRVAVVRRPL